MIFATILLKLCPSAIKPNPENNPTDCENPSELERDSRFRLDKANLWRSESTLD